MTNKITEKQILEILEATTEKLQNINSILNDFESICGENLEILKYVVETELNKRQELR